MLRSLLSITAVVLLASCNRPPSREEALAAIVSANPALDTTTAVVRVWMDGPPWFSCAEVIAKFRSPADSSAVRDEVGNWRTLLLSEWVSLRDTTAGHVTEPGWCTARLRDETSRTANGWRSITGDTTPTGTPRRGFDVIAGRQRVSVPGTPRLIGRDSARADYALTIAPNANGVAVGADRDTTRRHALLLREDGRWRVLKL